MVKIAAASADRSVSEWIEGAVRHELECQGYCGGTGVPGEGAEGRTAEDRG